jgi:hypothetical protein
MTYSHGLYAKVRWENGKVYAEFLYWPRCRTKESGRRWEDGGTRFRGGKKRITGARRGSRRGRLFEVWVGQLGMALLQLPNQHTHVVMYWGVSGYQIQQTSEVIRGLMIERGKYVLLYLVVVTGNVVGN